MYLNDIEYSPEAVSLWFISKTTGRHSRSSNPRRIALIGTVTLTDSVNVGKNKMEILLCYYIAAINVLAFNERYIQR